MDLALNLIQNFVKSSGNIIEKKIRLNDWVYKRIFVAEPEHIRLIAKHFPSATVVLNPTDEHILIMATSEEVVCIEQEVDKLLKEKIKLLSTTLSTNTIGIFHLQTGNSEIRKRIESKNRIAIELPQKYVSESEFVFKGNCRLKIIEGDILNQNVTVLVNPCDSKLSHSESLSKYIAKKAGKVYEDEISKLRSNRTYVPIGKAKLIRTVGDLNRLKGIILAVGPTYNGTLSEIELCGVLRESLKIAEDEKFDSIAIPAISCGTFGYPLKECTQLLLDTVIQWFEQEQPKYLKKIIFCDIKSEVINNFRSNLTKRIISQPLVVYHYWRWFNDQNGWTSYEPLKSAEMELAYQFLQGGEWDIYNDSERQIDFTNMEQKNKTSNRKRKIQRILIQAGFSVPEGVRNAFFIKLGKVSNEKLFQEQTIKLRGRSTDLEKAIAALKNEIHSSTLVETVQASLSMTENASFHALAFSLNIHLQLDANRLIVNGSKDKVNLYCKELIGFLSKTVVFPSYWVVCYLIFIY